MSVLGKFLFGPFIFFSLTHNVIEGVASIRVCLLLFISTIHLPSMTASNHVCDRNIIIMSLRFSCVLVLRAL